MEREQRNADFACKSEVGMNGNSIKTTDQPLIQKETPIWDPVQTITSAGHYSGTVGSILIRSVCANLLFYYLAIS